MKCQHKANNKRDAVVVCARHVVKRPSNRMRASTLIKREIQFNQVSGKFICNEFLEPVNQLINFQS